MIRLFIFLGFLLLIIDVHSFVWGNPGHGSEGLQPEGQGTEAPVPKRQIEVLGEQPGPVWKKKWDEARRLVREGDYAAASKLYQETLALKPDLEEVEWELVRVYMTLQDWDKAAELTEMLHEADPDRLDYLIALGGLMYKKGLFRRGLDLFSQALVIHPDDITSLQGVTEGLLSLGEKDKALPFLLKQAQLFPDDAFVRQRLARIYYEQGRYADAWPYLLSLSTNEHPDFASVLMAARVSQFLGQETLTIESWQHLLKIDPANLEAHKALADYYEKKAMPKETLPHLLAILRLEPENNELLQKIGYMLLADDQGERALSFFERYLKQNPNDRGVLQTVLEINLAFGGDRALTAYERYFGVEPIPDPKHLLHAARLYDTAGRYREAAALYKQILDRTPDNILILEALGKDLLALGEDALALPIWKRLASLSSGRVDIHRTIVALLTRLGQQDELLPMLEAIHSLDPADNKTTFTLAIFYREQGAFARSLALFDALKNLEPKEADFYWERGRLFESLNRPASALADYEQALNKGYITLKLRLSCVKLASRIGRLARVQHHLTLINQDFLATIEGRLLLAKIWSEMGFSREAQEIYQEVIDAKGRDRNGEKRAAWLGMAQGFRQEGRNYEAEQALRMILVHERSDMSALVGLFELALAKGQLEPAEFWFSRIALSGDESDVWQYESALLAAKKQPGRAVKICQGRLQSSSSGGKLWSEIQSTLAKFLAQDGRWEEAGGVYQEILARDEDCLAAWVGLADVYEHLGRPEEAKKVGLQAFTKASSDPGLLLELSGLYQAEGRYREMLFIVAEFLDRVPDSLKGHLLLASAKEGEGNLKEALAVLRSIDAEYPDNSQVRTALIRLLFRTGRFAESLERSIAYLANDPERPDILQSMARNLWALHRQNESISAYKAFLDPDISSVLSQVLEERNLPRPFPLPKRRTFLEVVTFSKGNEGAWVDAVMSPSFLLGDDARYSPELYETISSCYSGYQWQRLFAAELSARRAVKDREYYQAAKEFEILVREHPRDESLLFDLAGLYSRLERLGDEGEIYQRLYSLNNNFPGLDEALDRNQLKRRPKVLVGYGLERDVGWDGQKAMERSWGQVEFRTSPLVQNEFDLTTARIRYQSTEDLHSLRTKRAVFSWKTKLFDQISLSFGGGLEDPEETAKPEYGILDCSLAGKLGDKVEGRMGFVRDVVADTYNSIDRGIIREKTQGEISLDLTPRWLIGSDLGYGNYSDGNQIQEYTIWTSFIILPEPTFLRFRYTYDFKDTLHGSRSQSTPDDGLEAYVHPYWTPQDYWVKQASLLFKHYLTDIDFDRGIPRYYTAEYALGYNVNGHLIQTVEAKLFMEWTKHIIGETSAKFADSDTFRTREFWIAATYRW